MRMQAIVAFGFGAFFLSSLAIGIRLVWLAWRNRGVPELLIGVSILGIGPAGFALMVGALGFQQRPSIAFVCLVAAQLAIAVGAMAAYVFNWTVFRRDAAWARAVIAVAAVVFAASFFGRFAAGSYTLPMRLDFWTEVGSFNMIACMTWGSLESLRYYSLMRRRARLGLADPLLTNRFLLWGLGIGSAGVGSLIANLVMIARGTAMQELDGLTLSNSLFGLVAAVLMWIAFLPPAAYRRWIEGRAERAAAPA
jgi:hypothetical protein